MARIRGPIKAKRKQNYMVISDTLAKVNFAKLNSVE